MKIARFIVPFLACSLLVATLSLSMSCGEEKRDSQATTQDKSVVNGISGRDGGTLWAVKTENLYSNPRCALYSFSGDIWIERYRPDDYIEDICTGEGESVYACGGKGIYKFDGSNWALCYESPEQINSLSVLTPDNIWAVGANGGIFNFNGKDWERRERFEIELIDICAVDSEHIWAIGNATKTSAQDGIVYNYKGQVFFYNGSNWISQYETPVTFSLYRLTAPDIEHVWATNGLGSVFFYDGKTWEHQQGFTSGGDLKVITSTSSNSVWLAGGIVKDVSNPDDSHYYSGIAYSFDGNKWAMQFETEYYVNAIHATNENNIWIGTRDGVVIKYDRSNPIATYSLE